MTVIKRYRPLQPPGLRNSGLDTGIGYREYAPSKQLAAHVVCYWTIEAQACAANRIIPDGCVDIIIDRCSPFVRKAAFFVGLMTRYEVMSVPQPQSLFGIRLYPETAQSLLLCPAAAVISHHVYLEEVWGVRALDMVERMLSASTVQEMIDAAEHAFLRLLTMCDTPPDRLLLAGMQHLYASEGMITMSALADKLGFSERHVRRLFDRVLGVGPKELAGIVQFQSMLRDLHSSRAIRGLADIATKYGYYDQSHFIKRFKRYYGMLPTQLSKTD